MLDLLLYQATRRKHHPFLMMDDRRGLSPVLERDRRRGRASLLQLFGRGSGSVPSWSV